MISLNKLENLENPYICKAFGFNVFVYDAEKKSHMGYDYFDVNLKDIEREVFRLLQQKSKNQILTNKELKLLNRFTK